ncbi:MAG: histidine kinase [Candidatus Kapabacteria bacterium]|nr:histidine kinase [Candidatus Kapabacteria bacterium]
MIHLRRIRTGRMLSALVVGGIVSATHVAAGAETLVIVVTHVVAAFAVLSAYWFQASRALRPILRTTLLVALVLSSGAMLSLAQVSPRVHQGSILAAALASSLVVLVFTLTVIGGHSMVTSLWERSVLEKRRADVSVLELAMLRSQLNPHFLYNAIHTVYALQVAHREEASTAILAYASLLRFVSETSSKPLIHLRDELQAIRDYIHLQQLRFSDRFRVVLSASDDVATLLPPVSVLSLVENAFTHGVESSLSQCLMTIDISVHNNVFTFTVTNTVSTSNRTRRERSGTGLDNLRRRLHVLFGTEAWIETQEKDGLFMATMVLPLHKDETI